MLTVAYTESNHNITQQESNNVLNQNVKKGKDKTSKVLASHAYVLRGSKNVCVGG